MSRNRRLSQRVFLLLLALVFLGGCKQSGMSLTGDSTAHRQADLEIAIARSLERQDQTDRAIKLYLNALDEGYQGADAYHRLAVLHDKKGDCAASEEFYRKSLEIDPNNAEVYCDQGYSYYLQQRWPEAEESLRRALYLQPGLARAHNNLGLVLGRVGDEEEALLEFVRAGGTEAEARTNLAFALTMSDRWDDARDQFEMALVADPECEQAWNGFNTLKSVNNDSDADGWARAVDLHDEGAVQTGYNASPPQGKTYR